MLEGSGIKLKENPQNKEINNKETVQEEKQDINMKKGFFKKVWYSINKIEKYSELSAEGFGRAIKYLIISSVIFSMFSSLTSLSVACTSLYILSLKLVSISSYTSLLVANDLYSNFGFPISFCISDIKSHIFFI